MSAKYDVKTEVPEPYRSRVAAAVERGYALSPAHICEMFGVGRATVHNALTMGDLPGFRLGTNWRIRPENIPDDLAAYWAGLRGRSASPTPSELPAGELVYFIQGAPGFVKIGYTTNLRKRVKALQTGCPAEIELLAFVRSGQSVEREYHRRFGAWRSAGEWFRLGPPIKAEIERLKEEE